MKDRIFFRGVTPFLCKVMLAILLLFSVAPNIGPAGADEAPVITNQAEDYIDYFDKTSGNSGGQYRNDDVDIWSLYPGINYVGDTRAGEWLEYAIDLPLDG